MAAPKEQFYTYQVPFSGDLTRISDIIAEVLKRSTSTLLRHGLLTDSEFPVTIDPVLDQFSVGAGIAYDAEGSPVLIEDIAETFNATNPDIVDSQVPPQPTPQSTGCVAIPLLKSGINLVDTYILIQYLSTVDLTNTEHFIPGSIHGYSKWVNGYRLITSTLANLPTHIGEGALFLGCITKHRSFVPAAGDHQRPYILTADRVGNLLDEHTHSGYYLAVRCASLGTAEGNVIIEDTATLIKTYFPVTGGSWHEEFVPLQDFAGKTIKVYLASRGSYGGGAVFKWDGVRITRSKNAYNNYIDTFVRNYSFEQFDSAGTEPTAGVPTGVPGVMDAWTVVDLGAGFGWGGIGTETSGEDFSQYTLKTTSPFNNATVWGAVLASQTYTLPAAAYQLDGTTALKDSSVPYTKLIGTSPFYVLKAGDTMTGDLTVPNLATAGKVDGVDVSTHTHTNAVGDAPKITSSGLAANAVVTAAITDLNVTADKLAANSVTNAKIADLAISTDKYQDASVTAAKLAPGAISEQPFPLRFFLQGDLAITGDTPIMKVVTSQTGTFNEFAIFVDTIPTGSVATGVEIDIRKNGTAPSDTIFAEKPKIDANRTPYPRPSGILMFITKNPPVLPDRGQLKTTLTVAKGDVFSLHVTNIGDVTPGGTDTCIYLV